MPRTVLVEPQPLSALIGAILEAGGCDRAEADVVAEHLVDASLRGHDSHGVIRTERYHHWLRTGRLKPNQPLREVGRLGAVLQFDGGCGMGQRLCREMTARALEVVAEQGVAITLMRRAGHIGRVGAYAEQAAEAGVASVFFVNVQGSRLVAPFGARERAGSTAPVTIGAPNAAGDDFILDFATSEIAEGKALVAARGGAPVPERALVGGDGRPTTDPRAIYGDSLDEPIPDPRRGPGALRAFGDHKGSGLMLACELLGGALTGNGVNGAPDAAFGNGVFAVFIDPARFDDLGRFDREIAWYIDRVRGLSPADGAEDVMIPGDPERRTRAARLAGGLPMADAVFEGLIHLAQSLDIPAAPASLLRGADQTRRSA